MLTAFERSVGFAEGVVMSFDPGVLLPNAFAASVERGLDESLVACRNMNKRACPLGAQPATSPAV
jgi:hypothetical protein